MMEDTMRPRQPTVPVTSLAAYISLESGLVSTGTQ